MTEDGKTIVCLSDDSGYAVMDSPEEMARRIENAIRDQQLLEVQLGAGHGTVWINPSQVTTIRDAAAE